MPRQAAWWHSQNTKQRAIWPGLYTSQVLEGGKHMRADELQAEIGLIRGADQLRPGHIHFSFKALRTDAPATGGALRTRAYREPAQVPELPWLGKRP